MNVRKHKDDNLPKDPGVQNKKATRTEIITRLEHFQVIIDKTCKSISLQCMTTYLTGLGYRCFNETLRG